MKQFVCKPTIHMFPTCKDFLAGFDIGEEDLVLSNAYIFKPFFDGLDCRAKALFLEDYGQGEPSDTMVDALLAAASRYDFRRTALSPSAAVPSSTWPKSWRCLRPAVIPVPFLTARN